MRYFHQNGLLTANLPLVWIADGLPSELGPIQHIETVKQRPWSQVYRTVAERGTAYFKICGAAAQYEVSVLQWLLPQHAALLPEILATDSGQGWILMADAGIPFRDVSQSEQAHHLAILLADYARLQQHSLDHIDELLTMQVPDRRSENLSNCVRDLLEAGVAGSWFDKELASQVLESLPVLQQICRYLADFPYAVALDHGDLHLGNVLVQQDHLHICDWGDVCITHPFCSLYPMLEGAISNTLPFEFDTPTQTLIDSYLNPWTCFAPMDSLKIVFQQALSVASLLRALDIFHMLGSVMESSGLQGSPYIAKQLKLWIRWSSTLHSQDV